MQVKKDFQEAVLSYRQDEFFCKNMYANFGDIGSAVKELVDEFQKQTSNTKRINTIEDMQVRSLSPTSLQCSNLQSDTAILLDIICTGRTSNGRTCTDIFLLMVHTATTFHCTYTYSCMNTLLLMVSRSLHIQAAIGWILDPECTAFADSTAG